jgi:glutathione S-transferase
MFELYIANKNYSSWSLRPWVLLRELGVAFAERQQVFGSDNYARFRRFSPTGKVPCLVDGSTTVWDSLAIAEYLAERHAGVWPADAAARAWARSAAAEMHAGFGALREHCSMNCGVRVQLARQPPELLRDLARLEELWADGLGRFGGPFLAGAAFGAVDAYFAPVAFRVQSYGLRLGPAQAGYVQRLLGLGAMRRWYDEALAETWRDPPHEADLARAGRILEDFRAPPA